MEVGEARGAQEGGGGEQVGEEESDQEGGQEYDRRGEEGQLEKGAIGGVLGEVDSRGYYGHRDCQNNPPISVLLSKVDHSSTEYLNPNDES